MTGEELIASADVSAPPHWLTALSSVRVTQVEIDAEVRTALSHRAPICSVVRGLLGERFRELRCLTGEESCAGCAVANECAYNRWLAADDNELPPRQHWLQGVPAARSAQAGDRWLTRLCVVGDVTQEIAFLQVSLKDGLHRLGMARQAAGLVQRLRDTAVRSGPARLESWSLSPVSSATRWRIQTVTPIALRNDLLPESRRRDSESCPAAPELALLLRLGVRRWKSLWHAAGTASPFPAIPRVDLTSVRAIRRNSRPWRAMRNSGTQKHSMPLEGIELDLEVSSSELAPIAPLLASLPTLNVGRLTTMGFGQIEAFPIG